MERMGRSTYEAYGAAILSAIFAGLTWAGWVEDMRVVIFISIVVFVLLVDITCRSPITISRPAPWKVLVIIVVAAMAAWADFGLYWHHLDKYQEEVFGGLSADAKLPSSKDVFASVFKITNGDSHRIIRHATVCGANFISSVDGKWSVVGMAFATMPGGRGWVYISGPINAQTLPYDPTPIDPSGDVAVDLCLSNFRMKESIDRIPFDCFDVSVMFFYSIEEQGKVTKEKIFRFLAKREKGAGDELIWDRLPNNTSRSPCYVANGH
jgi:hypothetical protein